MKERKSKSEQKREAKAVNIRKIYAAFLDQYEANEALLKGKDVRKDDRFQIGVGQLTGVLTNPEPQPSASEGK